MSTTMTTEYLTHRAALGDRVALKELKALYPRREFRRFWHDFDGYVLKCRAKGSKADWKRL